MAYLENDADVYRFFKVKTKMESLLNITYTLITDTDSKQLVQVLRTLVEV